MHQFNYLDTTWCSSFDYRMQQEHCRKTTGMPCRRSEELLAALHGYPLIVWVSSVHQTHSAANSNVSLQTLSALPLTTASRTVIMSTHQAWFHPHLPIMLILSTSIYSCFIHTYQAWFLSASGNQAWFYPHLSGLILSTPDLISSTPAYLTWFYPHLSGLILFTYAYLTWFYPHLPVWLDCVHICLSDLILSAPVYQTWSYPPLLIRFDFIHTCWLGSSWP